MPMTFKTLAGAMLGATLLVANPLSMRQALAQDAAAPSQLEREFWASSQQIGTEAAYRAYLTKFPNGYFAPLAAAALKKAGDAQSDGSAQNNRSRPAMAAPAASVSSASSFNATRIAGPTGSRAITQQTGDVFYGPGPITVGWLGSKKQVVIPAGAWVLLSAEDGASGHATPIPLTAMVLARLEASTVRSLLLVRFNSRSGNSRSIWTDAKACEEPPPSAPPAPFAWHTSESGLTQCVTSSLRSSANTARMLTGPLWQTALQALASGGAAPPSGTSLLTEMYYTGDLSNYMKVSRVDFGVTRDGTAAGGLVAGQAAPMSLSVASRQKWAESYAALAALGYRKKLSEEELNAGEKPTSVMAALPE